MYLKVWKRIAFNNTIMLEAGRAATGAPRYIRVFWLERSQN